LLDSVFSASDAWTAGTRQDKLGHLKKEEVEA
jgi:hypothetical protein